MRPPCARPAPPQALQRQHAEAEAAAQQQKALADKAAADLTRMAVDMTTAQQALLREREALNNLQVGKGGGRWGWEGVGAYEGGGRRGEGAGRRGGVGRGALQARHHLTPPPTHTQARDQHEQQ